MPKWAKEDKKFAYRWVKADKFSERSDGWDPRGWEKVKIPASETGSGEFLRFKEHILAKMPIEEAQARREAIDDEIRLQTEAVVKGEAENLEKLNHEVKQLGGKIKLNVNIE
jgi:hypothetical protein